LMQDLYRLGVEYENETVMLQLDGSFQPVTPSALGDRTEMTVAVALTPEEQQAEAQKLLTLDTQFSSNPADPTAGGLYGQQQRHALLSRAFELLNIKDGAAFLQDPNDPAYQQQQMQQQQMQQQQQQAQEQMQMEQMQFQAQLADRQTAVVEGQLELDALKESNRVQLESLKQEFHEENEETKTMIDVKQHAHKVEMDEEELELEKTQARNVNIG